MPRSARRQRPDAEAHGAPALMLSPEERELVEDLVAEMLVVAIEGPLTASTGSRSSDPSAR
jgi:hypothetical protein